MEAMESAGTKVHNYCTIDWIILVPTNHIRGRWSMPVLGGNYQVHFVPV